MTPHSIESFKNLAETLLGCRAKYSAAVESAAHSNKRVEALNLLADVVDDTVKNAVSQAASRDREAVASAHREILALEAKLSEARRALGADFIDVLREATECLSGLIADADIRRDPALRELALQEAEEYLAEARKLSLFIDSLMSPAEIEAPPSSKSPAPNADGLPVELSSYVSRDKSGFGLKDFAIKYADELKELLIQHKGNLAPVTELLKERGLNGGSLTQEMVEGMLRNAGVRPTEGRYRLVSSDGNVVSASNAIDVVRAYFTEVLGLEAIYLQASRMFTSTFKVSKYSIPDKYELRLSGYDLSRLEDLVKRVCRALQVPAPTWERSAS